MSSQELKTLAEIAGESVDFYEQIKETAPMEVIKRSIKGENLNWLGDLIFDTVEDFNDIKTLEIIVQRLYQNKLNPIKMIADKITDYLSHHDSIVFVVPDFMLGYLDDSICKKSQLNSSKFKFLCRKHMETGNYLFRLSKVDLVLDLEGFRTFVYMSARFVSIEDFMRSTRSLTYKHLVDHGVVWEDKIIKGRARKSAECQAWTVEKKI